ncbi:MAG: hypothetical protein HY279_13650, partial [Nitrospinae bacterium]|nr:hypothetical protein [Nitrospinota bacterium]
FKGGQGGLLKPEMFASAKIDVGQGFSLVVPESAVQREGENTIVFVATPPSPQSSPHRVEEANGFPLPSGERAGVRGGLIFEKRVVSLGSDIDGYHPVISGLKEGERLVTKGAFTLKSESLKGLMEED